MAVIMQMVTSGNEKALGPFQVISSRRRIPVCVKGPSRAQREAAGAVSMKTEAFP